VVKVQKPPQKTESGLFIPEMVTDKEKPTQGTVLAVGPGRTENGVQIPVAFAAGDEVIFSKFSGIDLKVENEEILMLTERDVLGVVESTNKKEK
jgi:chaperonin GroES